MKASPYAPRYILADGTVERTPVPMKASQADEPMRKARRNTSSFVDLELDVTVMDAPPLDLDVGDRQPTRRFPTVAAVAPDDVTVRHRVAPTVGAKTARVLGAPHVGKGGRAIMLDPHMAPEVAQAHPVAPGYARGVARAVTSRRESHAPRVVVGTVIVERRWTAYIVPVAVGAMCLGGAWWAFSAGSLMAAIGTGLVAALMYAGGEGRVIKD